mmetsp:Transcript_93319/g.263412  ORF Transcript_93319/g.263412 Transcript_93319/m.263412 type:complete len:326 (-) Transcript_93319:2613-3590(-)
MLSGNARTNERPPPPGAFWPGAAGTLAPTSAPPASKSRGASTPPRVPPDTAAMWLFASRSWMCKELFSARSCSQRRSFSSHFARKYKTSSRFLVKRSSKSFCMASMADSVPLPAWACAVCSSRVRAFAVASSLSMRARSSRTKPSSVLYMPTSLAHMSRKVCDSSSLASIAWRLSSASWRAFRNFSVSAALPPISPMAPLVLAVRRLVASVRLAESSSHSCCLTSSWPCRAPNCNSRPALWASTCAISRRMRSSKLLKFSAISCLWRSSRLFFCSSSSSCCLCSPSCPSLSFRKDSSSAVSPTISALCESRSLTTIDKSFSNVLT